MPEGAWKYNVLELPGTMSRLFRWISVFPRLILACASLSLFMTAGCRVSSSYTVHRTLVELRYDAESSTAVYAKARGAGEYTLDRYEGATEVTMTQAARWGMAERVQGESSRTVAQPLCTQTVRLDQHGEGARLVFGGGETCELRFVVGSWQDYLQGRRVVLKLGDEAWGLWTGAIQASFVKLVESHAGRIQRATRDRVTLDYLEDPDILVHEKPLIEANQSRLMVFFERLEITNRFAVVEWTRGRESVGVLGLRVPEGAFVAAVETGFVWAMQLGLEVLQRAHLDGWRVR